MVALQLLGYRAQMNVSLIGILADCPAMPFVFVCWHKQINTKQLLPTSMSSSKPSPPNPPLPSFVGRIIVWALIHEWREDSFVTWDFFFLKSQLGKSKMIMIFPFKYSLTLWWNVFSPSLTILPPLALQTGPLASFSEAFYLCQYVLLNTPF